MKTYRVWLEIETYDSETNTSNRGLAPVFASEELATLPDAMQRQLDLGDHNAMLARQAYQARQAKEGEKR